MKKTRFKMAAWEINLRDSLKLEVAQLAIDKENAHWQAFGAQSASAAIDGWLSFEHTDYEYMTSAVAGESKMVAVAATRVNVTKNHALELNRFKQVLGNMEITSDLVLTMAQRKVLEPMMTANDVHWQVWWSYRLKHTGATAVCLRNGTDWMTLFEDGTSSGNYVLGEYYSGVKTRTKGIRPSLYGTWFFNPKAKRSYTPPKLKNFSVNLKTGQINIRG